MKSVAVLRGNLSQKNLTATYYVCPTKHVDAQIENAERWIQRKTELLVRLREERKRILKEKGLL